MRKLLWLALPLSAAVFLSVYLLPEGLCIPAGLFCALAGLTALFFRGNGRRKIALAAAGLCVGFLWTGCYTALFRTPAHALAEGQSQLRTMTVLSVPAPTSQGAALTIQLTGPDGRRHKAQLYADEEALALSPGDVIRAPVRLSRSDTIRGERFDYYDARGIYLLAYAESEAELIEHPETPPPRFWPQRAAQALKGSITSAFSKDVSPFLIALITGDKTLLPTGLYAAFQRSGVAHIVAVSGLHVSFLIGLISILLGKRSRGTFVLGLILVLFFVLMTGASPSALRAAFMLTFVLLAPLVGREEDRPTTFAAILALLLLANPYAAASVSLQLSFAAVAGISVLTPALYTRWITALAKSESPLPRLVMALAKLVIGTLSTTLGALLFTTPLSILHFQTLSLLGPVTNLLVLWLIPVLFIGGLFVALLGLFLPQAAALCASLLAQPIRWVIRIVRAIAALPMASLSLRPIPFLLCALVCYAIILLWLVGRREIRPVIPLSTLAVSLLLALAVHILPAYLSPLSITALDVGQGASTLFFSRGSSVLIDCGGNGSDDPGDVAADYLQSLGRSQLDLLILTHYHADHAGGVPQLLSRVRVKQILLPDVEPTDSLRREIVAIAEAHNCKVTFLSKDSVAEFGVASLTIFAPLGDGGANEEGLSVLCSAGEFDALVTGDMNAMVERMLVKYKSLPDIELLLVGHHGSRNSTSESLLTCTTPEQAIISCGYNTYGHPNEETLERLGAAGCRIYRTDQMGSVTVTVK